MHDAIIIGGGIVGAAIAYHLTRQKVKTLLLDRLDPGRATDAGAGILAPEVSSNETETWFNFAVEAVAYYPELVGQLEAAQAGETGYARCGLLVVAVANEELPEFETNAQLAFARRQRREDLGPITPAAAKALFPPLAEIQRAIYSRQAARVDGRLLAQAMLQAARQQGLTIRQESAARLNLAGDRVTGVEAGGETLNAGAVVIAGGAWSPHFGSQLGLTLPVEPQRGQIIHLHLPEAGTADWPIVKSRHGYYLVCWPGGRVVAGATRETGSGFAPQTTARGIQELLGEALWLAPGLAEAEIREIRVGLRPRTPDSLPVLGLAPGFANVYLATGHGATGLQLGPYSGKLIADVMTGQGVSTDLSAFGAERFL